ncbi:MAG: SPASM domain-containing protein [Clostridia bacterium]|nr:SPASM domain-containing protein [Clostridia bacterium]
MLKASNYNFFYPEGEEYIAYNSFHSSLVLLTKEDYQEYLCALGTDPGEEPSPVVDELIKNGFLVQENCDELAIIRHRMYKSRYNTGALGLTIAPTTCCNFRCVYCYEDKIHRDIIMDNSIQQAIIEYVRNAAKKIDKLHVAWYGGEPLLALNIVERLSDAFIEICDQHGIEYTASIVTNGYLLDRTTAKLLVDKRVRECQITIDGDREYHDQRRPHYTGKGTYDTIIKNIIDTDGIIPTVSLRVNTDKNNPDAVNKIIGIIKEHNLKNYIPYAAPVHDYDGTYCVGECFTQKGFLEYEYDNLMDINDPDMIMDKYPVIRDNICCADTVNGLVINADGKLYKCWSDIGVDNLSYGNIKGKITSEMNEIRYIMDDPTRDPKCSACKLLPLCMGGCPRMRRMESGDKCIYYEDLNEKYMKHFARIAQEYDMNVE